MQILTLAKIRRFIMAQRNSRRLSLYDGNNCILSHYCESKKIKYDFAVFSAVELNHEDILRFENGASVLDLFPVSYAEELLLTDYGLVKAAIRKHEKETAAKYSPFDDSQEYHESFA